MEVICHGESMASSITEDSDIMVESSGGVAHNHTLQDPSDTPLPPPSKKLRTPGTKTRRRSKSGSHRKRQSKVVVESPVVQSIPLIVENGVGGPWRMKRDERCLIQTQTVTHKCVNY